MLQEIFLAAFFVLGKGVEILRQHRSLIGVLRILRRQIAENVLKNGLRCLKMRLVACGCPMRRILEKYLKKTVVFYFISTGFFCIFVN